MAEYRVTFGQKHARQYVEPDLIKEYPDLIEAHPNNWIAVEAETEMEAIEWARTLGNDWSMIYGNWENWGKGGHDDQPWEFSFPGKEIMKVTVPV